jgi:hypothetical protein
MEADTFSFGMLCLWLLFEIYLSGIRPVPGLDLASIEISGPAEDTLSKVKANLQVLAQQFLATEAELDDNQRRALKEFFHSSLSNDPQQREGSIQRLLIELNPEW